ncbi:MAG: dihydrolipoyl dehydrogenase [Deltaproteobacteria bacterium]|nr:dihydrolipoyl dehydrogenase [Deltaproteobacteria bacterium]
MNARTPSVSTDIARVEVVVIGAGPGGYVAGIRLGQLQKKVVVIEKAAPGGVCLNVGCIPSKALINAAKLYEKAAHGADMGIRAGGLTVDFAQLQKWKDGVVAKLTGGVRQLLRANGCEYRQGTATLLSPRTVQLVEAGSQKEVLFETEHVVIATGARPVQIPNLPFDDQRVVDSTGALAFAEPPKRLVVVGAGYIGMEIGTLYAKFGSQVTFVEALPTILPGSDAECVQVVARKAKKLGMEILLGAKAKGMVEKGGEAVLTVESKDGDVQIPADKVLVAVGRRPNSENIGLEIAGVKTAGGFVAVDRQMRTSVPNIFAIGDVAGQPMLAHKASKEAEVAAEAIADRPAAMDAVAIPAVVFTDPEIASAGLCAEEAEKSGHEVKVGKFPLSALGRAIANLDTDGFAKVVMDADGGQVLGVHIVGGGAGDLISEAALGMEMGASAADIGMTVHPHPTLSEAIMEAAKAAQGEAIHIVNR